MNIHGLDPVLQWNQPFDLRAATPTGQGYAGILLKSSLSPCSLCQGSFTLSIGGQDLGQAPAGQCTWYIMRQDITQWPHQDAGIWQSLPQSRMVQLVFWKLKIFLNLALSARGTSCGNFRKQPALAVLFAARAACASFETDNAERYHANKSWPALSLPLPLSLSRNFNPFEFYPYLLKCSYSPKLSVLHCCTGICHKLLPLAFKRVTSLETKGMKWKSPTSGTTPVIGWIQSAVETFSQFKLFRSV